MAAGRNYHGKSNLRQARRRNSSVHASLSRRRPARAGRSQIGHTQWREPYSPPEDWHEPTGRTGYRIVEQPPGDESYRHVLTPEQIRSRLADLPEDFLRPLEVVQLSRLTRKKLSFPCYGMQWGSTIYLYPVDVSLMETFSRPPRPYVVNEARMFGGRWDHPEPNLWTLTWTESAIQDFYLNNILIHELGHLLDNRNSSYVQRERYAEWFAIEYGYRRTGGRKQRRPRRAVRKRHHS